MIWSVLLRADYFVAAQMHDSGNAEVPFLGCSANAAHYELRQTQGPSEEGCVAGTGSLQKS